MMTPTKKISDKEIKLAKELKPIIKNLPKNQKKVIQLLQKKEVLIIDKVNVLITCGKEVKKVSPFVLYSLINKGLITQQKKTAFNYGLTTEMPTMKV